jgi:Zn finger protein HypA/HybF involved in hydrogenase expression
MKCPHCGGDGYFIKAQARGTAEHHFAADGTFIATEYDALYFKHHGAVRCVDCGKIRRDVEVTDEFFIRTLNIA